MAADPAHDTSTNGAITATDFLRQQHADVKKMLADVAEADSDTRSGLFDTLKSTLKAHESAEQACIHPEARTIGDDASRVVDARLAEEAEADKALHELVELGPDSAEFGGKFSDFRRRAEAHAAA